MSRYRRPVSHSSDCSTAKALTNRRHDVLLGKILTTRVRRFISWFSARTIRGAHTPAVRLGEGQGRKALLDVLLEKFGDPGMAYAPAGRQLPSVPSSHS